MAVMAALRLRVGSSSLYSSWHADRNSIVGIFAQSDVRWRFSQLLQFSALGKHT